MVDFIEEVEERLRADRYASLARRVLPWFAVALAAAVIGWLSIWGYHTWRDRNIGAASIVYDKGVVALAAGDQTGAYADFAGIAKTGPAGYRSLGLIQQGNIRLMADKTAEAVALYDAAAKAAPNAIFGDLARLKAALALMDEAPYPQVQTRLSALIGDKKPYDLQAREALAMAKLQAGRTQEARGDFNALTLTLGVTQAMRVRAQAAIALIDSGQASMAAQVVRAAATLPPSNGTSLSGLQGAPAPQDGADTQDQTAPPTAPDNAPGAPR